MARPDLALRRAQSQALLNLQRIRHASERRVETFLREIGLDCTPAQANVLMVLFEAKAPMTARQIAGSMELSEVTVGRFVRAMERDGWVSRERDPSDSRAILIRPTAKARDALPAYIRVSNTLLDEAFDGFTRAQIQEIAEVTQRVCENLTTRR